MEPFFTFLSTIEAQRYGGWKEFRDYVLPGVNPLQWYSWPGFLFWLVGGFLFWKTIRTKQLNYFVVLAFWFVVVDGYFVHILLTVFLDTVSCASAVPREILILLCGYLVRWSSVLFLASIPVFSARNSNLRNVGPALKVCLLAILLLSLDWLFVILLLRH